MFNLSIRDVLWLTVVAALGVGWLIEHFQTASASDQESKWESRHQMLVEVMELHGWNVTWTDIPIDPASGKGGSVLCVEPPEVVGAN